MRFIKIKTILTKIKYGNTWYGILYHMNDIIDSYKKGIKENEQLTLFLNI